MTTSRPSLDRTDEHRDPIVDFTRQARRTVNVQRLWTTLIWGALITSVLLLLVGVGYRFAGHRVPALLFPAVVAAGAVAALLAALLRRMSVRTAERFVDDHYDLKDAVVSARGFARQGKKGEFYELQARSTRSLLASRNVADIPYAPPTGLCILAALFFTVAGWLALQGDSPAVARQKRLREETALKTAEINDFLEEELGSEEEKAAENDAEEPLIDAEELKKLVGELEDTSNREDALRQYAALEKKIQAKIGKLETKQQEKLLDKIAAELKPHQETRKLGKELSGKKYREAAKELESLKQNPEKSLSEQRKDLARLRATAKRMNAAVKSARQNKQNKGTGKKASSKGQRPGRDALARKRNQKTGSRQSSGKSSRSSSTSSSASSAASESKEQSSESAEELERLSRDNDEPTSDDQASEELAESVEELESLTRELQQALDEALDEKRQNGQCSSQSLARCKKAGKSANRSLSKLGGKLRKVGARRSACKKLGGMCKKLSACSSYLCNSSKRSLTECLKAGGKKAGWGSVQSETDGSDTLTAGGELSQLKGIRGQGPSTKTSVEDTESGDGTAGLKSVAKKRSFRRQLEAFVERDDVPEDVKDGVKSYFKNIHGTKETTEDEAPIETSTPKEPADTR